MKNVHFLEILCSVYSLHSILQYKATKTDPFVEINSLYENISLIINDKKFDEKTIGKRVN